MYLLIIGLSVVILDQLTKHIVAVNMTEGMSIPIINHVFHLTYILNAGAAFGMLENSRWFFVAMAILVLSVICYYHKWILREDKKLQYGIVLFAAGTLGNLIDRILRGLVVDFFDFRIWPIFNVADIAICVGVGLIIWSTIQEELVKKEIN